jgi:hypothetical protein
MRTWKHAIAALGFATQLATAAVVPYIARSESDPGGIAFNYVDISGTGTVLFANVDDIVVSAPLAAPFTFYGETGIDAVVSSNGVISFTVASNNFANDNLPSLSFQYRAMMAYWDDLVTTGFYQYFVNGVGPFSGPTSVFQWVGGYCSTGLGGCSTSGSVDLQVLLEHDTGRVLFQYLSTVCPTGECLIDHSNGSSATVGIQSFGGLNAEEFIEWSFNSAVIGDGSTILFEEEIPEPSGWVLLGVGLAGIGLVRRRQRR